MTSATMTVASLTCTPSEQHSLHRTRARCCLLFAALQKLVVLPEPLTGLILRGIPFVKDFAEILAAIFCPHLRPNLSRCLDDTLIIEASLDCITKLLTRNVSKLGKSDSAAHFIDAISKVELVAHDGGYDGWLS
mmetsp:Transcript_103433/g.251115  ORF Transcript_103433/g.251115 Transcript_103433/m.251115 type:complete len:134 (+) Transcript_103433:72-473(+)